MYLRPSENQTGKPKKPLIKTKNNSIQNKILIYHPKNKAYKRLHKATKFGLIHISQRNTRRPDSSVGRATD
ncbi:hypothetical protein NEIFL0001_0042 [Neisseria flavescens SK114]|nr:hypothetical protein NEIFL0001_0042 [Neisseria flavescens SK114]